jgi:hypothetical protein
MTLTLPDGNGGDLGARVIVENAAIVNRGVARAETRVRACTAATTGTPMSA